MISSGIREGFLGHLVDELSCGESTGFPLVVAVESIPENSQGGWGGGGAAQEVPYSWALNPSGQGLCSCILPGSSIQTRFLVTVG